MAKKRIMKEFKLNEISAVDFPAQEGARMTILKRAEPALKDKDGNAVFGKSMFMTTSDKGHAHLIEDTENTQGGSTSWASEDGDDYGHSHPWIRNSDGSITIGESNGHSHGLLTKHLVVLSEKTYKEKDKSKVDRSKDKVPEVEDDEENPGKEKPKMTTKSEAEKLAEVTKANEDLQGQIALLTVLAALSDVEKAFHAGLDAEGKKAFIAKSADARKADVQAAELAKKDSNPVVYKAANGTEYRKSDDQRLVEMAKQADADRAELAKAREANENAAFEKRAEAELKHLPGEVAVKVAVLKAVAGIKDEAVRKAAEAMLKANDNKLSEATKTLGSADAGKDPVAKADAEAKLNDLAKKYAADNKVQFADAYLKVMESDEGKKLYDLSQAK